MFTSSRRLTLLLLLAGLAWCGPADSIAAVVGENLVLESDLDAALDFVRIAGHDTTPDSLLRLEVLEQLISNEILQERAREDTITVTREEIGAEVTSSIDALKERFDDEAQYRAALAAEGITEPQLRRRYEEDARRKLLSRRLMDKEGLTQVYVSPAEAERFYNEHRDSIAPVPGRAALAHILLMVTPSPEAESSAQLRVAEVMDILGRGGDFDVVRSSFSEDDARAGWQDFSALPPELVRALQELEPGEVSRPFRIPEGYCIARREPAGQAGVRRILIRVSVTRADTMRVLARARAIRQQALSGVDFDSLARELSMDPMTADSGGFLGTFLLAGLTAPFDSVVAHLDSGAVSDPVFSEHGCHLLKVLDKEPDRMMSYLEMQDMIRNFLYQQKLADRLKQYLERVSSKVYVKRFTDAN